MAKLLDIVTKKPKTFVAPVKLFTSDGDITINFTCRYRDRVELNAWLQSAADRKLDEAAMAMEAAEGWDLEDEFTQTGVEELFNAFYAFGDLMEAYRAGLRRERIKN